MSHIHSNKYHTKNVTHSVPTEELLVKMVTTNNPVTKAVLAQCVRARGEEPSTESPQDYDTSEQHLWS